jgi:tetratricopeptide (TPR) repeat protein
MTSATAAYRKDLAANGRPFGVGDGDWIMVGSLVERAAELGIDEAESLLTQAADTAATTLGAEQIAFAAREWGTAPSGWDPITLLAIVEFNAGARHSSAALLDAVLVHLRRCSNVALGRALAQRARVAFWFGEHELAEDLYGQVERLGRVLQSAELQARAVAGEGGLRQVAGNFPAYRASAQKYLAFANESGITTLIRNAHYSGMMSSAMFKLFDEALRHGWELYRLSAGNAVDEAFALQALGQLFLDMGDPASARAAHAAVTRIEAPPRLMLSALGGLAVAAAATGDGDVVDWAVGEIERFRDRDVPPFSMATALLDAAIAQRDLGRSDAARRYRDEAINLAELHRYNQISYRADTMSVEAPPATESARVGSTGEDIVRSVRRLEPSRLPEHVRVAIVHA